MLLYHGSNVAVANPKILIPSRTLDFGPAFYTTSSRRQAIRWAQLTSRRRGQGVPTVTVYEFDSGALEKLSVLVFDAPSIEWLRFVSNNRNGEHGNKAYDLVVGPVANDRTMAVIGDYMAGNIDDQTALVLLRPQKLDDQYAFRSHRAIQCLHFAKEETIDQQTR